MENRIKLSHMSHWKSVPYKQIDNFRDFYYEDKSNNCYFLDWDRILRYHKATGYDGIELHCAHGYLLNEFYSPITNKRKDEYGGTPENRLRFLLEAVKAVRGAIGDDVPMSVRLGGADYLPGGSKEEDAVQAAIILEKSGVNLMDVSGGMCFYMRPGHLEPGYFSSMTEKIKSKVSIPVLLTGGIKTVADAERLLTEEKADLIGVGRAILKDANWRAEL